jgi:hypothetical protein
MLPFDPDIPHLGQRYFDPSSQLTIPAHSSASTWTIQKEGFVIVQVAILANSVEETSTITVQPLLNFKVAAYLPDNVGYGTGVAGGQEEIDLRAWLKA